MHIYERMFVVTVRRNDILKNKVIQLVFTTALNEVVVEIKVKILNDIFQH